jgi:hypothetical protein
MVRTGISEDVFERTDLAVIEGSFNSDIVYICVGDGGHLGLLNGRNPTFGMEDENRDVLFVPEAIDRCTGCW